MDHKETARTQAHLDSRWLQTPKGVTPMAKQVSTTYFCDFHDGDIAQALCKNHMKLLCLGCVLDKAKSAECSITEIRKLSDTDSALLECLMVKQIATTKLQLIEQHKIKTTKLKDDMLEQVTDFHKKLTSRLDEMKDNAVQSIKEHASPIIASTNENKQKLHSLEERINNSLETFSSQSDDHRNEILGTVRDIQKELEKIPDKDTGLEGEFTPAKCLEDVFESELTLGTLYLIENEYYSEVGEHMINKDKNDTSKQSLLQKTVHNINNAEIEMGTENKLGRLLKPEELKPDSYCNKGNSHPKPSKGIQTNSESGAGKNKQKQSLRNESDKNDTNQKGKQEVTKLKNIASSEEIVERRRGGLFGFLGRKKSDKSDDNEPTADVQYENTQAIKKTPRTYQVSNVTDEIYQEVKFDTTKNVQLKDMINKKTKLEGITKHFDSSCKFSKIVYLGDGYIGLLSKSRNTIVFASIEGKIIAKKEIEGVTSIVSLGDDQIDVVKERTLQVSKFKVNKKRVSPMGSFIINEDVSNITGFDFDGTSQFAVSSPEKLLLINKTGDIIKVSKYDGQAAPDIVTTYDFHNDCLYILDANNKTLEGYYFGKPERTWRQKYDDQLIKPRNMCLYKDKLCVAFGNAIALFTGEDGKPIVKHDTYDLLDDCYGICVADDVILFSSYADDFDRSAAIAFINL